MEDKTFLWWTAFDAIDKRFHCLEYAGHLRYWELTTKQIQQIYNSNVKE
jgi:hypothetical protein